LINQKKNTMEKKVWKHTESTQSEFEVAGVNLANFGLDGEHAANSAKPFELYEDFDIGDQIKGTEGWDELLRYKIDGKRKSLAFYVDKVAQKRWRDALGIPQVKFMVAKYASELTSSSDRQDQANAIKKLLPKNIDYAAKPSHMSCSKGIYLVKYDPKTGISHLGENGHEIEDDLDENEIATGVARKLHERAHNRDSYAARKVSSPGIVIEERFAAFDDDEVPAMEFKVFCIWGQPFWVNWRRGVWRPGILFANGTALEHHGTVGKYKVPDWVDWESVMNMARKFSIGKDLARVDIIVGVPAGSPSLEEGATKEEQVAAVQTVLSEVEFKPGTHLTEDHGLFDEMARLWMAGYEIGNYRVVPNTEIPASFQKDYTLSEADAKALKELQSA
jgi:hypothetical protein